MVRGEWDERQNEHIVAWKMERYIANELRNEAHG